jgi:hypothetical protein
MSKYPCVKMSSVAKMESLEEDSVIVARVVTIDHSKFITKSRRVLVIIVIPAFMLE